MPKNLFCISILIALFASACSDESMFVVSTGNNNACNDGDEKCSNSTHSICQNNIWTVSEICENGCDGKQCTKTTQSCTDGQTVCNDNILKSCQSGNWIISECKNGCDGNVCKEQDPPVISDCTDGDIQCQDNILKKCQSGNWNESLCPYGCANDHECTEPSECNDDDTLCTNDTLKTCQNNHWDSGSTCPNGCHVSGASCANCKENDIKCTDNQKMTCLGGDWTSQTCDNGCSPNGKDCAECKENAATCENNTLKSCKNGAWTSQTCDNGCNANKTGCADCKENAATCENNTLKTCKNGAWNSQTCNNGCNADKNGCAECKENTVVCENNTLKTCKTGKWTSKTCENGCNSAKTACESVNNNQPTRYIMTNRLLSPITPYVLQSMKNIAAKNSSRSTNVVMKVGDSHYDYNFDGCFMKCFSTANSNAVTLDSHTNLQKAINDFQKTKDSFMRDSKSALGGKSTRDMFNSSICGSTDCITQEINAMNPRFAFFGHGTNDMGNGCYSHAVIPNECDGYASSLQAYYRNLNRAMDVLINNGVIPLISAIAPRNDTPKKVSYMSGASNIASTSDYPTHMVSTFNAVARGNAEARQIPFFDTFQAFYPLASHGIRDDDMHGSTSGSPCNFTASGLKYGVNTRNLYSMEMLNNAWNAYTSGNAPDKVIEPFKGSGTAADPYIITSLPFTHSANTKNTGKNVISTYSGCAAGVNEYGPEVYYKLELSSKKRIRTFVVSERLTYTYPYDEADLDIHILRGSASSNSCIKRDDIMIHGSLAKGTYYFVIDTFGTSSNESANRGKYLFGIVECDSDDKYCDPAL